MRVEIEGNGQSGRIQVWVHDGPPDLSKWMQIEPGVTRPILTESRHDPLDRLPTEIPPVSELVEAARLFIKGEVDRAAAEERMARALKDFSDMRAAYS